MNNEVNVLALVKGQERYVFMYNDQNREEIVESFGRYASDPDLSFTWLDAATLTQKALREKRESELRAARMAFYDRISRDDEQDDSGFFGKSNWNDDLLDL